MRKRTSPAPKGGAVKANPTPEQIKTTRMAAKLTQEDAAELIYATSRAWQEYEGGRRRMHAGLFELFEIKVAELPQEEEKA